MKWIILFFQILVSTPDREIIFSGLTTCEKMTKATKMISDSFNMKVECVRSLKELKGN